MRRPEPRDAAALLVDQDRCVVAADAIAQRSDEFADLSGRAAIAPEQNEADRIDGSKEIALESAETLARTTQDDRAGDLTVQ